jgi:thiol:disulfide interchange protein DsbA
MNARAVLVLKLGVLVTLALCVGACGRSSARRQAAAASQGTLHRTAAAAVSTSASQDTTANVQESETLEDDHSQDRSDVSLERLATLPPDAQLPAGRWRPGVNYMPLVPAQTTNVAPGKVEVLEVFWLGCPHCYALEPYLQRWLKSKPSYVEFVRVPVMWGPVHRAHARLYYTLLALGREDLVQKAFDAIQHGDMVLVANSDDETLKLQQSFARQNGINPEDYAKAYNSFSVSSKLQQAVQLTQRYQVSGVPYIVIDGKYATDPGVAGSLTNLFSLVDDLAAAEHTHGGRS